MAVDVPALADQGRLLDYSVAPGTDVPSVGTMVRVTLQGRRVAGWVVAVGAVPPAGVRLQPIGAVSGLGPSPEVVDLTAWGAWRWAGRRTALLRAASPPTMVRALPAAWPEHRGAGPVPSASGPGGDGEVQGLAADARAAGQAVVRWPPSAAVAPLLAALLGAAPGLVVVPSVEQARHLTGDLRAAGVRATLLPGGWSAAAAGGTTVVGARAAAWGPAPGAEVMVVVDAHDTALVEERAPAWSAWVVAAERARRLGVPCVLLSPCPSPEQLQWGTLVTPSRAVERQGWAPLQVIDRRAEDPRSGLLGDRVVPILRAATLERRVLCVVNRKGRVRLLACRSCGALVVCERCGSSVESGDDDRLCCRRCGAERALVCQGCGSAALRALRSGTAKLREELASLSRLEVGEVTADVQGVPDAPVLVGTEALLYRLAERPGTGVGCVVFLDFDAELNAPRYRAGEDALGLLARASRVVGGRDSGGRVVVQTRQPDHGVVEAALRADPSRFAGPELALRRELGLPPAAALAELSGDSTRVEELARRLGPRVECVPAGEGRWLVRASDHTVLCDALAAAGRPAGPPGSRLRVDVDPLRV